MNEIDKAIYLMQTFQNDKVAIGKVIHEILYNCNHKETLFYKKVWNIVINQKK